MAHVTEPALLAAWESAAGRPPVDRAVTLAAAASGLPIEKVADLPLGDCDLLLLRLREQCFGPRFDGLAECPRCRAELDVSIELDELQTSIRNVPGRLSTATSDPGPCWTVEVAGTEVQLRPLTSRDIRACGGDRDRLLARCVTGASAGGASALPGPDVLAAVEAILDALDPQAAIALDLDCPECGATWQAPVDITEFVWTEVDRFAQRLLYDVHTLARAYGWTEPDVLAVSPARRRFYLEACAS
jgi:hypothetical protein